MRAKTNLNKTVFFKRLFIKICRIFGYELIDQGNFHIPTQDKLLNENISIQGKKSINLPLGEVQISRKVKALTIIFRSCTNVNMLTQNKKRLFDCDKSEYTFRSLHSIISSLKKAKNLFPKINFNIIVVDHNSGEKNQDKIKNQLIKSTIKHSLITLDLNEFKDKIKTTNEKNESVTKNQISNMSNIYKSLLISKDQCEDLIYFVEDDYIHHNNFIEEMILTYERISSQTKKELILCPADYPYLYTDIDQSSIFLGSTVHWRTVNETLCTFLTSKVIIEKYWDKLISMCEFEHYPFEQPLHDIYKLEYCLSPIPSLAFHCTNINSIFGLSPNVDWKKAWDNSKDY